MNRRIRSSSGLIDDIIIVFFAVGFGLIHLFFLRGDPFLSHPIIDGAEYLAEARGLLAGLPIGESISIHGPVYSLMLLPLVALYPHEIMPIYLFQILLLATSALFVRRSGMVIAGRGAGNVAAFLLVASPPMLYFEAQVLPVLLQVFWNSILIYLLIRPDRERPRMIVAGVIGGLSYLTHPGVGLPLLCLSILLAVRARSFRPALLFCLGILMPLIPMSAHHIGRGEGILPVQGNAGLNLYIGNGIGSDGTPHVRPGYEWERLTALPALHGVSGSRAENAFFLKRLRGEIAADPTSFLKRLAAKGVLFLSPYRIDASQDPAYFRERSPLLRFDLFGPGLLMALAMAALVLGPIRKGEGAFPITALLAYGAGTILTVYAIRYRAPAWPFVTLLVGAFTSGYLAATGKQRGAAIFVLIVILGAGWFDPFAYAGTNHVRTDYNLGRLFYLEGDWPASRKAFERAHRRHPNDPDAPNALGALALAQGKNTEAEAWFNRAIVLAPDYGDAHFNLGLLELGRRNQDLAEEELEEAIRLSPRHAAAHYTLGIIREQRGDFAGAEEYYENAVRYDPTRGDAWTALGVRLAARGAYERADLAFGRALLLDPRSEAVRANRERLDKLRRQSLPR